MNRTIDIADKFDKCFADKRTQETHKTRFVPLQFSRYVVICDCSNTSSVNGTGGIGSYGTLYRLYTQEENFLHVL